MPNGIAENEICPVFRASLADGAVLGLDPREVQEACWVSWHFFSALAADPEQPVSPWCRRQAARLSRLGDDPRRWPASSLAELIPAAFPPQAP
jgi:isopentenyl-diphosphate delta-isomerase